MPTRRLLILSIAIALLAGCGDDGGAQATITNFCINGTPAPDCPPTHTPDNTLHVSCPVTAGETVLINGTPYVIFARPCTPTPTPINAALTAR